MFGTGATTGLTIGKVVSGISKTLGIVNQAIPIYREVKPMIGNAKNMFSIVKEFSKGSNSTNIVSNTSGTNIETSPKKRVEQNNSTLTFFQ